MSGFNARMGLAAALLLAVPSLALAEICLTPAEATDPNDQGFAVHVQQDQGQGSIDCTAFIGPGGRMHPVPVLQDKMVGTADPLNPIHWTIDDPDPHANVDVVFIGNSDGSRCTQFYKANARAGFAASGTKDNKASTLIACADGFSEPAPQDAPVPPVSTAEGCTSDPDDLALQEAINDNGKYDVVIGIGRGAKGDNTAICADDPGGLGAQKRCVLNCITPEADSPVPYDPDAPECEGDGPFYPLKCRACELSTVVDSDPYSNDSPPYCWEQLQKVDYTAGTFKKAPGHMGIQTWTVTEYKGSTCYLVSGTTDSGYRYSYLSPKGCTVE